MNRRTQKAIDDRRRNELIDYRSRLVKCIDDEAKKHGFTFAQVAAAYKLPKVEKELLDQEWLGYYSQALKATDWTQKPVFIDMRKVTNQRPFRPNPCEYQTYLEYCRVDSLINSLASNDFERNFL